MKRGGAFRAASALCTKNLQTITMRDEKKGGHGSGGVRRGRIQYTKTKRDEPTRTQKEQRWQERLHVNACLCGKVQSPDDNPEATDPRCSQRCK